MPKLVVPVSDTDSTVSRLIARSVIDQLMFSTEMPLIQDVLYVQRGGIAAMAQVNAPGEALKLDIENHLFVEYRETIDA